MDKNYTPLSETPSKEFLEKVNERKFWLQRDTRMADRINTTLSALDKQGELIDSKVDHSHRVLAGAIAKESNYRLENDRKIWQELRAFERIVRTLSISLAVLVILFIGFTVYFLVRH